MRLIGTLAHENEASKISLYLKRQGIESKCEGKFDPQSGQISYHLWILDEDQIEKAAEIFDRFQKSPSDTEFEGTLAIQLEEDLSLKEAPRDTVANKRTPLTLFLLILCIFVFFLSHLEQPIESKEKISSFPVKEALLYDIPPKEGYWHGLYDWLILIARGEDSSLFEGTLFNKIRQGEVWRLFSPVLLHVDFLHILFNMIWLWVLGRPIEQRIGWQKTALLTLIAGVGSNTAQYLMGGPFFMGYSGIITALAGFIWMRQWVAPWEGYPLSRVTFLFLLLFVGAMFALSLFSFFLQISTLSYIPLPIANTAHIAGGVIGALLARFPFFSRKASDPA